MIAKINTKINAKRNTKIRRNLKKLEEIKKEE